MRPPEIVVDRRHLLREDRGVPEEGRRDERAELDPLVSAATAASSVHASKIGRFGIGTP